MSVIFAVLYISDDLMMLNAVVEIRDKFAK